MDYISRKVFLTKNIRPYDSDGDGVFDTLILSATTKHIQIPLRSTFDDMGIFETIPPEEQIDIIDIGSFWDDTINGNDIPQPPPFVGNLMIDWGSGDINGGGVVSNDTEQTYCGDITANNYQKLTYNPDGTATLSSSGGTSPNLITGNVQTFGTNGQPLPIFTNCCCIYDNNGALTGGGQLNDGSNINVQMHTIWSTDEISPQTIVNGVIVSSLCGPNNNGWLSTTWNNSQSTIINQVNAYCVNNGYGNSIYTLGNVGNLPPGGDCSTVGTLAFLGVKLKNTQSEVCVEPFGGGGTKYRYEFCFYCI